MSGSAQEIKTGAPSHCARLYRDAGALERGVSRLSGRWLAGGEPVLVMAARERLEALTMRLGAPERLSCLDLAAVGLNPARIIPVMLDWIKHNRGPLRIVSEPVWPGRSQAEIVEVLRHEALVEEALGTNPAKLLCVYEEAVLPECARPSLERSHLVVTEPDGSVRARSLPPRPAQEVLGWGPPLEPPCEPVEQLPVTPDLGRIRARIKTSRALSELAPHENQEFVLAINEAAANALQHGRPPRALRLWRSGSTVVGEVACRGRIEDPLAGRRVPTANAIGGRGLWMVNQLCDLVEVRSSRSRTTLRMHKRRSHRPSGVQAFARGGCG